MDFMTFGPSEHTHFGGFCIDDWTKWTSMALFSFLNTGINEFLGSALVPFFTNTIEDHKTKYIPYSKGMCIIISQTHTIYCHVMGVFGIFLMLSQIDFLMIRLAADLIVNHYTVTMFLKNKETSEVMYHQEYTHGNEMSNRGEVSSLLAEQGTKKEPG